MDQRRRRRMKRRAAEAADDEDRGQRPDVGRQADQRQHADADERARPAAAARGRQRSARWPKPSCDTEFASWKHICSVPAAASDRFSCGISSGSSGAKMLP